MKILLINVTYGIGSTGKIVESLYNSYSEQGHDVRVIYGRHSNSKDPSVMKGCFELESKIHHAFSKLSGNLYGGMHLSTLKIKRLIKKINPDAVHLHCLNGYFVNIYSLIKFLKKNHIRTILTNHADFMFTANCGYALDCENWKSDGCKNCKHVKSFNGKISLNRTSHFFKKMKKAFEGFEELTITNVSSWLNERSKSSDILKAFENETVLNPVAPVFFDKSEENPYIKLGLSESTKKILYVTPNFNEKEKGGYWLETIANKFKDKDVKFILISSVKEGIKIDSNNIIVIKEKITQKELASYYQYADCTLLLSERETFSMVVAESLASGAPVVGFKAGGPETICIPEHAIFVDQKDINSLVNSIEKTIEIKHDKNLISEKAKAKYHEKEISKEYLKIAEKTRNSSKKFEKSNNLLFPIITTIYFAFLILTSVIPAFAGVTNLGSLIRYFALGIFSIITLIISIKNKNRIRPITFMFLVLITLSSIIVTTITYLEPNIHGATVDTSINTTLKNVFYPVALGVQLLATLDVLPKTLSNRKVLTKYLAVVSIITLLFVGYAIYDQFTSIYSPGGGYISNPHRNLNGYILFVGFIHLVYLSLLSNKKVRLCSIIGSIITYLAIVMTLCKGAIVFSTLIGVVLFFYSFKKHLKRNIAITAAVAFLAVAFVVIMEIKELRSYGVINTIYESFYHQFYKSFAARMEDLNKSGPLFQDWRIIFGYGDGYWLTLPHDIAGMGTTDNAFFITILSSGFIGLSFLTFLTIASVINAVLLFRQNKKLGLVSLTIIVSFFVYEFYIGDGLIALNLFGLTMQICTISITKALLIYYRNSSPKKVLHVVECLSKGGTEAFIYNYNEQLRKEGYEIDVYCLGEIDQEQKARFEKASIKIFKGSLPSIKNYIKSSIMFDIFMMKNNYSIVHCDANFDSALYLRLSNYYGAKVRVFHSHDTMTGITLGLSKKILYGLKRLSAINNATHFAACSKQAGYDIIGARFFSENGSVVPNIINPAIFSNVGDEEVSALKAQFGINENDFVLGNISRFEPKKNQKFIIEVFEKISNSKKNAKLVLGGIDGGQEKEIKQLVEDKNLSDKVIFIGPRNDVPACLKLFDIYLFPSLFEGLGIVCLENQCSGLKTIASINVPKSTDLGLGLIDFLPLETHIWVDAVINMKNEKHSTDQIINSLASNGYLSTDEIKKIYE